MKTSPLLLTSTLLSSIALVSHAFVVPSARPISPLVSHQPTSPYKYTTYNNSNNNNKNTPTQLRYGKFVDVPDGFFTFLFPMLSIALAISKQIARTRLEERAWELRLEDSRRARIEADPSLTMKELRRQDAAKEYSVYGRTTHVMEQATTTTTTNTSTQRRRQGPSQTTSQQDIEQFQEDFGMEYDPYYDDPYTEEELPEGEPYKVDKVYGDRVYDNGEIFYFDKESNMFFRQGSKPRIKNFWS